VCVYSVLNEENKIASDIDRTQTQQSIQCSTNRKFKNKDFIVAPFVDLLNSFLFAK